MITGVDLDIGIPLGNVPGEVGRWKFRIVLRDGVPRQELPPVRDPLDQLDIECRVLFAGLRIVADDEVQRIRNGLRRMGPFS
jgi:hypothetical protein